MLAPGCLSEWDAQAHADWEAILAESFGHISDRLGPSPSLVLGESRLTGVTSPDWSAFPSRVAACLTREAALNQLDVPVQGRHLHEEYCEWRTIRNEAGVVTRVEFTTELAAYWRILAIHDPRQTLEVVSEFAREAVPAEMVYGLRDPVSASPDERAAGFAQAMFSPQTPGPYNWGQRAICCMVQRTNTLDALLKLAVTAARPRLVHDAEDGESLPTAEQVTPPVEAQPGRSSDPVLVERLSRLALEGRAISFDDPLGIYIAAIEHTRLRCPDGASVPSEWFHLSRGVDAASAPDGRARQQRVVFEVPADAGFVVGDLVDVATEEAIRSGAQIADLLQLVLNLRAGEASERVDVELILPSESDDPMRCQDLMAAIAGEESALW